MAKPRAPYILKYVERAPQRNPADCQLEHLAAKRQRRITGVPEALLTLLMTLLSCLRLPRVGPVDRRTTSLRPSGGNGSCRFGCQHLQECVGLSEAREEAITKQNEYLRLGAVENRGGDDAFLNLGRDFRTRLRTDVHFHLCAVLEGIRTTVRVGGGRFTYPQMRACVRERCVNDA